MFYFSHYNAIILPHDPSKKGEGKKKSNEKNKTMSENCAWKLQNCNSFLLVKLIGLVTL